MNKKGLTMGVLVVTTIASTVAFFSSSSSKTTNLDMSRTHGTVSTAMRSLILGDPSASITIVEFGDYQCHQFYN